ncbi:hypothetical protein EYS14_00270 [Alteromonadaceae bacterium M269]|nr:hypothetical protein EYS14_00270 [Alteromonadaceae bacterium M269]
MKYLVPAFFISMVATFMAILIINNDCMALSDQFFINVSIGSCDLTNQQTSVSTPAFIFWIVMNIAFAVIYQKPNIAAGYKIVAFILGLPITFFVYLIAKISQSVALRDSN